MFEKQVITHHFNFNMHLLAVLYPDIRSLELLKTPNLQLIPSFDVPSKRNYIPALKNIGQTLLPLLVVSVELTRIIMVLGRIVWSAL